MKNKAAPAAPETLVPEDLFRSLAGSRGLVLAVSGGPDSTALMLLAARWAARPPVLVVCVDHGLRAGSADEARLVAANAAALGLTCRIMQAPARPARGNLQDWARQVRYACLAEAAEGAGCDTIVTAHHRDDQAETFLLRLARGSGVYGLAGMANERRLHGLRLVRPLLAVPRSSLAELAAASGLPSVDDPSNGDRRFDRVRMRALIPALGSHGLTPERLAETAVRMRRASAALDHYADALLHTFATTPFGAVEGRAEPLAREPEEVALRALARVLQATAGAEYTPPLSSVENLLSVLVSPAWETPVVRTLHGCLIRLEKGRLRFCREWGRAGPPAEAVAAGQRRIWDGRFAVLVPARPGQLSLGPLGQSGQRLACGGCDRDSPRTLPGLFADGALVAVPGGVTDAGGAALGRLDARCLVGERLRRGPFTLTAGSGR